MCFFLVSPRPRTRAVAAGAYWRRRVGLVGVLVLLAGCARGGDGDREVEVRPELLRWMGDFCTRNAPMRHLPKAPELADPPGEADRRPLKRYLADTLAALETTRTDLAALPTAPTAGGTAMLRGYRADLEGLERKLRAHHGVAGTQAPGELNALHTAAVVDVRGFRAVFPHLRQDAEVAAAYDRAAGC